MEGDPGRNEKGGGGSDEGPRRTTVYSLIVGIAFVALIVIAGINTITNDSGGVLGSEDEAGLPLEQFAVPDARLGVEGDANIAQDDCDSAGIPCSDESRRTPACEVEVEGAIRVCDMFNRPLILSFWFTRGGDCEDEEDVVERAYRSYKDRINVLAIDVRDDADEVRNLIEERGWSHPVGLDRDGALSNLYRVGGCPTIVFAYPGGILHSTAIGELTEPELTDRIEKLLKDSREREEFLR